MQYRRAISGLLLAGMMFAGSAGAQGATPSPGRSAVPAADPSIVLKADVGGMTATIPGIPDSQRLASAAKKSSDGFTPAAAETIFALGAPAAARGGVHIVGDLDGDGAADRLAVEQPAGKDVNAQPVESVTYRAVSGRSEEALWTLSVAGQVGTPVSVKTGDGGLVVATLATTGAPLAQHVTLSLHGVSSAGKVRWTEELSGTFAFAGTFTYTDYPLLREPLRLASGRDAVHVELLDWVHGGNPPYPSPGGADAVIIDARSGRIIGRPAVVGNGLTLSFPAGDLNGDGGDDVAFTIAQDFADGAGGDLWAAAASGRLLWGRSGVNVVTLQSWTTGVGDADGDGMSDIAIGDGSGSFGAEANPGVVLYSGATGEMLWAREGELPHAVGDLDGDGRAEVVLRSFHLSAMDQEFRINVTAVRPNGTTLYHFTEEHSLADAQESFGATMRVYLNRVDLSGDRVPDLRHEGFATSDDRRIDVSGALSGRNGRRLFSGSVGVDLGRGLRGRGHDLVRVVARGDGARLTAVDGASGAILWRRTVRLDAPIVDKGYFDLADLAVTASAGDVNGDNVNDVAVIFEVADTPATTSARSVLLHGTDGRILRAR